MKGKGGMKIPDPFIYSTKFVMKYTLHTAHETLNMESTCELNIVNFELYGAY